MADTSPEKDALEERAWEAWAIVSGVAYRDRQHGLCFYDGGTKQMSWRTWQGARATPPSPSTAPEVPPFPESFGLADVPHAMNTPDDWDADYRATWQKLQVAEINLSQMRAYARKLRAALASRPAEVDDKGLPPLRTPEFCAGDLESGEPVYTAEQYRQGQRDAVAADRARRGDINPEDAFVLYSAADVIDECGKVLVALKVRGIADRVIMPEITKAPR